MDKLTEILAGRLDNKFDSDKLQTERRKLVPVDYAGVFWKAWTGCYICNSPPLPNCPSQPC